MQRDTTTPPPLLERARQALRVSVCRQCYQRWPGKLIDPRSPRACEPTCTIFENLPQLLIAASESSPAETPDAIVQRYVCITCLASVSGTADFCGDRITRTCPLSRYAADVLLVLNGLEHSEHEVGQQHGFDVHLSGSAAAEPTDAGRLADGG